MEDFDTLAVAIVEPDSNATLTVGIVDTGAYGNDFDGQTDDDGLVTFDFESTGVALDLTFDAYDADSDKEIAVAVNGTVVSAAPRGSDGGLNAVGMEISADLLVVGVNELTFLNTGGATWTWGVTNVLLTESSIPELTVGVTDTGSYGNDFDGTADTDGLVEFAFEATGAPLTLSFDAYDADSNKEIEVSLNGEVLGLVQRGADNGLSAVTLEFPAELLLAGSNVLSFANVGSASWTWGVTNILLTEAAMPELVIGTYETGIYGNDFEGTLDVDGEVMFGFGWDGTDDLVVTVRGYDIDSNKEVEVLVNGVSVGYLDAGASDALEFSSLSVSADLLSVGDNTLTFVQTGGASWTWGVTDVLVLNSDINETEIWVDPEFTQDGYVAWVTPDAVILGRIDEDTGALIEVLNVSDIAPQPVNGNYNGPEMIVTADGGPGAIAIADDGLIYINATESRLLENTFGYRVGLLPKGEVPHLRFNMIDDDGNVYIWDEGVVTEVDIGDPENKLATWINPDEAVVFGPDLLAVYNVVTGETTVVAENMYTPAGNIAALERADGTKVMALYGDGGEFYDFWTQNEDGIWEIYQTGRPPFEHNVLQSPELFEWDGELWLSGTLSIGEAFTGDKVPVLYNVDKDLWSALKEPASYIDPEAIGLNDGKVVYYYSDLVTAQLYYFTTTYDELMASGVPSLGGEPDWDPIDSPLTLDPEFTADGYTAWMDNSAAYLGRVDLETGELLEVLNQSEVSVSPDVELIRTSDGGVALIGISDQGLVYVSETETYVLDGTEGMRIGFLPKGETPGLRFTMVPEDTDPTDDSADVYLYDNGVVTLLDLGDPGSQAISWLNGSEVVVYNQTEVLVYNVDTEELSYVGENVYEKGHSASLETSGGQRIIAIQGDSGDFYDLYRDAGDGWELLRRASPPASEFGPYFFSPELFEWQGRMFMSGIMAEVANTQNETVLVLYDLLNDTWSQVSPRGGEMIDPEALVLEDGSVALYFRDTLTQSTKYVTVTPEEVDAIAVPGALQAAALTAPEAGWLAAHDGLWSGLAAMSTSALSDAVEVAVQQIAEVSGAVLSDLAASAGAGQAETAPQAAEIAAADGDGDEIVFLAKDRIAAEPMSDAAPQTAFEFRPGFGMTHDIILR